MAGLLNLTPISDVLSFRDSLLGSAGGVTSNIKAFAVELVQTATCTELRLAIPGGFTERNMGFNVVGNKLIAYAMTPEVMERMNLTPAMGTAATEQPSHSMAKEAYGSGAYEGDVWYREFGLPLPVEASQLGISVDHGYLSICLPVSLGIKPENIDVSDFTGKKESFTGEGKWSGTRSEVEAAKGHAGEAVEHGAEAVKKGLEETTGTERRKDYRK